MGDRNGIEAVEHIEVLAQAGMALCAFRVANADLLRDNMPARLARILGYADDFPPGLLAITHPHDVSSLESRLADLSGLPADVRLRDAAGAWRWFEVRLVRSGPGEVSPDGSLMGVCQDITARKKAELEHEKNERLYRRIVEDSPIGIAIGKPHEPLDRVNKALCTMLGHTWYPDIALDLASHTHPDDLPANLVLVAQSLKHEVAFAEFDKRYIRADGAIIWAHLYAHTLYDEHGEIEYGVVMSLDTTKARAIEAERHQNTLDREHLIQELEARNAEMERFIYTVSHDLKSPLITIQGFLGYLLSDIAGGKADRVQRDIDHIGLAVERMNRLLQDLLELSRVGRLLNPLEAVCLDFIVMDAVQNVFGQMNRTNAILSVQNGMPTVWVDRQRLVEVFQNLLDNALKFMGVQPVPHVRIGAEVRGDEVVCFVQDNGIGIEPRYQEKIFGLFERLDPNSDGTGIGLALVRRIIETHQGRIWVESVGQGQGCTFYFTLPQPGNHHDKPST